MESVCDGLISQQYHTQVMGRGKDSTASSLLVQKERHRAPSLMHKAMKVRTISWETLPVEMEPVWILHREELADYQINICRK